MEILTTIVARCKLHVREHMWGGVKEVLLGIAPILIGRSKFYGQNVGNRQPGPFHRESPSLRYLHT